MWFPRTQTNPTKVSLTVLIFTHHMITTTIFFNCHVAFRTFLKLKYIHIKLQYLNLFWKILTEHFSILKNEVEAAWKGKYQRMDNTKIGKERGNSYKKKLRDIRMKRKHKHWKLNWNILTITDVFLLSDESKCMWTCSEDVAPSLPHVHIHLLSSDRERNHWWSKFFS